MSLSDVFLVIIYSRKNNGEIENEKYLGIIVSGRVGNNYKEFSKKLDHQYLEEHFGIDKNSIFEIPRDGLDTKIKNKIPQLKDADIELAKANPA